MMNLWSCYVWHILILIAEAAGQDRLLNFHGKPVF